MRAKQTNRGGGGWQPADWGCGWTGGRAPRRWRKPVARRVREDEIPIPLLVAIEDQLDERRI